MVYVNPGGLFREIRKFQQIRGLFSGGFVESGKGIIMIRLVPLDILNATPKKIKIFLSLEGGRCPIRIC